MIKSFYYSTATLIAALFFLPLVWLFPQDAAACGKDPAPETAGERTSIKDSFSKSDPAASQLLFRHDPASNIQFRVLHQSEVGDHQYLTQLSYDKGTTWTRAYPISYEIPLRYGTIVPFESEPEAPTEWRAPESSRLYIVQFHTVPTQAFRSELSASGAEILAYLPNLSYIVRLEHALIAQVQALPFVRWVGQYHPIYKISPDVLALYNSGDASTITKRFRIQVFKPGFDQKFSAAESIRSLGGAILSLFPEGYLFEAEFNLSRLPVIAALDEILYIASWGPPKDFMDNARMLSGANYVENVGGYDGSSITGEVLEHGVWIDHQDFNGPLVHGTIPNCEWFSFPIGDCYWVDNLCQHGTNTFGEIFGNGNRDGYGDSRATGLMPSGGGIAGGYCDISDCGRPPIKSRYTHTLELLSNPYFASFQSNSWSNCADLSNCETISYDLLAAEMDYIIRDLDIPIAQAQGNGASTGAPNKSAPEAWAKNIISIGGLHHYNNVDLSDDSWLSHENNKGASIGPAEDGRIKPDVVSLYDEVFTTNVEPIPEDIETFGLRPCPKDIGDSILFYTPGFAGTSAATPIAAGNLGLILEMWADNLYGTHPWGGSAFEKRPHASTSKALLINTAKQYPIAQIARVQQGWGMPSAGNAYAMASKIKVMDELLPLVEFESHSFQAQVIGGEAELKITMVYTDPPGTTSSTLHRINDLNLRLISPNGSVYWGNWGLYSANYSNPGGGPDLVNTVENVFIRNPQAGIWTVEVTADAVNIGNSQDYALVANGVASLCGQPALTIMPDVLPDAVVGVAYQQTLWSPQSALPIYWEITSGALPPGLGLNPYAGIISGTPVDCGVFSFTVKATDNFHCPAEKAYTLLCCEAGKVCVLPQALPFGRVNEFYSQQLQSLCGTPPYAYSLFSGSLPPGLGLIADRIEGTPTMRGLYIFTIQSTDATGKTGQRTYEVIIFAQGQELYVSPESGTTAGGTRVTIYSFSGIFTYGATATFWLKDNLCANAVWGRAAEETTLISPTMIRAVTPRSPEGCADVRVAVPGQSGINYPNGYS